MQTLGSLDGWIETLEFTVTAVPAVPAHECQSKGTRRDLPQRAIGLGASNTLTGMLPAFLRALDGWIQTLEVTVTAVPAVPAGHEFRAIKNMMFGEGDTAGKKRSRSSCMIRGIAVSMAPAPSPR